MAFWIGLMPSAQCFLCSQTCSQPHHFSVVRRRAWPRLAVSSFSQMLRFPHLCVACCSHCRESCSELDLRVVLLPVQMRCYLFSSGLATFRKSEKQGRSMLPASQKVS